MCKLPRRTSLGASILSFRRTIFTSADERTELYKKTTSRWRPDARSKAQPPADPDAKITFLLHCMQVGGKDF